MMRLPLIPLSIIRDLKCRHCQNFVSCGPVYVVPDESILCGRCRHLAKDIYRNTAYEALASMFMYPCYNWENHCSRTLLWNESLQHEEECSYNGWFKFFWHHPRAYCKGKREIPEGDIRLTPVPERLLDHIKCVQCECYLTCEPVFIQTNGKNVCHRCVHANGIPPNCLRNLAYERLCTIVIFPCIYRNRGCPTRLKFGRSLWQHEAECSYGQIFKKITKTPSQKEKGPIQKERGVIMTHSGHYYGTITPNGVLFAPPNQNSDFDVNKELLKSLKKQQERRFMRADEIGTQFERNNSEDGSVFTEDYEKSPSISERSSPTRLDDTDSRPRYQPQIVVEPGYFSNNNGRPPQINGGTHPQNLFVPPVPYEDYSTPRISPYNSFNNGYSPTNAIYANVHQTKKPSDDALSPKPSFTRKPNNLDSNVLAGHYPVFGYSRSPAPPQTPSFNGSLPETPPYSNLTYNGGLQSPSFNGAVDRFTYNNDEYRLSTTESVNSNKELIDELKVKLMKNNSMKAAAAAAVDSPYKECNNLEDIVQAHDRMHQ